MLLGLSLLVSYISNFGVVVSGSVLVSAWSVLVFSIWCLREWTVYKTRKVRCGANPWICHLLRGNNHKTKEFLPLLDGLQKKNTWELHSTFGFTNFYGHFNDSFCKSDVSDHPWEEKQWIHAATRDPAGWTAKNTFGLASFLVHQDFA